MRFNFFPAITFVALYCITLTASAQNENHKEVILDSAILNARLLHQEKELPQLELYAGAVYDGYVRSIKVSSTGFTSTFKGVPYFAGTDWEPITLKFRGINYYGIRALYDMYIKTLIIQHYNSFISIELENEGIESFELKGHRFKHFRTDEVEFLEKGIYRYLNEGVYTGLVLDAVYIYEQVTSVIEKEFLPRNEYYIVENGKAQLITSSKSLLQTLDISAKDFRKLRKTRDLRWKTHKEELIKMTLDIKNK